MLSVKFILFICFLQKCVICVYGDSWPIYFKSDGTQRNNLDLSEHDECNRTNGILWTCQKLKNCPEALDRVKMRDYPVICGFEGNEPIICCKLASIPNGSTNESTGTPSVFEVGKPEPLTETKSSSNDGCNRTNGIIWECHKLKNCPEASDRVKRHDYPVICGFEGNKPIICFLLHSDGSSTFFSVCTKYSRTLCINRFLPRNRRASLPNSSTEHTTVPWFAMMGAVNSNPKEFPHMALIGYGDGPDNISWQCGGTLISENFVLSAAHCTFPGPKVGLAKYVRIGDLNTASDTDEAKPQQFEIIERIDHPEYRPPVLYNDIALYRLDRNATFDEYVRPLCLYQSYSLPEGAGVATGWGRTEFAGPVSKDLQKANLTYIDSVRCNQLLKSSSQLPRGVDQKSMVCAGESDGSKDTCQGDSGGPLAMQKHLQSTCLASQVGITSFGRQCGLPDSPGVYTRVAHFLPWIESIVWPGPV